MTKYEHKSNWLNYFRPTIYIKSFSDINIFLLKKMGVRLLVCDLDNTLSPHFTRWPNKKVMDFCKRLQENKIKLAIVSNNTKKRVLTYTSKLQPDEIIYNAKKPLKRKIVKMLERLDLEPNEVIFLGDQFITDVWVANRIGCKSILVLPIINQSNDNSSSRLIRFLDKFIYKKLEYGNYLRLDYARGEGLGDEHQFI